MSEVTAALTPEEWAKGTPGVYGWDDGSVFFDWRDDDSDVERPHAVAAALLHQQPFGFTQQDVAILRYMAKGYRSGQDVLLGERVVDQFESICDRIAALLPPTP